MGVVVQNSGTFFGSRCICKWQK